MIKLRPYQEKSVAGIRDAFNRGVNSVLFCLATGGGKTYTFSYIAYHAAEIEKKRPDHKKRGHIIILVHRKELMLQASKSLRNLKIDHGMISPYFTPQPRSIVQVATIKTLASRMKKREYKVGLLIPDEAHHVHAKNSWGKIYNQLGKPRMLGVTATPCRGDGIGLGTHAGGLFDEMVVGPPISELIAQGHLVNPEVYMAMEIPDFSEVRINADGEYDREQSALTVDKPKITGDAVDHYKKICPGSRAIVFCTNIKHAENVVAEFNAAGFKFDLLVGAPRMCDTERTSVNRRLESGELDGACTVDLVSEGYDLPALECCIMLRRVNSLGLFLQQVGRIMRPFEGRKKYLLDHVGNVGYWVGDLFKRKHGLPNEDREWSLDGKKKKTKSPTEEVAVKIRQCTKCYHVHEAALSCPKCGFIYPIKSRTMEQIDGELVKVTEEMLAGQIMPPKIDLKEQGKAKDVAALVALGRSEGQAEHIISARIEKQAIISGIIGDLTDWQNRTGELPFIKFGVSYREINSMKPKQLKELRAKMELVIKPPVRVIDKIIGAGFKLELIEGGKVKVDPIDKLSEDQRDFIIKNKSRIVKELEAQISRA